MTKALMSTLNLARWFWMSTDNPMTVSVSVTVSVAVSAPFVTVGEPLQSVECAVVLPLPN